jgi:RNA polymerase sigma-70 factor, ECF subfamily
MTATNNAHKGSTSADGRVGAHEQGAEPWVTALRSRGRRRDEAILRLHELLLRAARFELSRRRAELAHVPGKELAGITLKATGDALATVLANLDDFRGVSRFTTWASKFALHEASLQLRRRAWQHRDVVPELESTNVPQALRAAIVDALGPHQREVFLALAVDGVPIDVLAERLNTTRSALHGTLQDARGRIRRELDDEGRTSPSV